MGGIRVSQLLFERGAAPTATPPRTARTMPMGGIEMNSRMNASGMPLRPAHSTHRRLQSDLDLES